MIDYTARSKYAEKHIQEKSFEKLLGSMDKGDPGAIIKPLIENLSQNNEKSMKSSVDVKTLLMDIHTMLKYLLLIYYGTLMVTARKKTASKKK